MESGVGITQRHYAIALAAVLRENFGARRGVPMSVPGDDELKKWKCEPQSGQHRITSGF
jgi:hypothetical protein